jgi:tRNA threonylcarbamoyladenosine biosynthesis protein TsaB
MLSNAADYLPSSAQIAYLGVVGVQRQQAVTVEQAMPVYLRDKVAKTTAERMVNSD